VEISPAGGHHKRKLGSGEEGRQIVRKAQARRRMDFILLNLFPFIPVSCPSPQSLTYDQHLELPCFSSR
jgi:hypothetical protein